MDFFFWKNKKKSVLVFLFFLFAAADAHLLFSTSTLTSNEKKKKKLPHRLDHPRRCVVNNQLPVQHAPPRPDQPPRQRPQHVVLPAAAVLDVRARGEEADAEARAGRLVLVELEAVAVDLGLYDEPGRDGESGSGRRRRRSRGIGGRIWRGSRRNSGSGAAFAAAAFGRRQRRPQRERQPLRRLGQQLPSSPAPRGPPTSPGGQRRGLPQRQPGVVRRRRLHRHRPGPELHAHEVDRQRLARHWVVP